MGVILPELESRDMAENTVKEIFKLYARPFIFNGVKIKMSTRIGISFYPNDSVNEKQLMKYVDLALQGAKKSNQNEYRIYGL